MEDSVGGRLSSGGSEALLDQPLKKERELNSHENFTHESFRIISEICHGCNAVKMWK